MGGVGGVVRKFHVEQFAGLIPPPRPPPPPPLLLVVVFFFSLLSSLRLFFCLFESSKWSNM